MLELNAVCDGNCNLNEEQQIIEKIAAEIKEYIFEKLLPCAKQILLIRKNSKHKTSAAINKNINDRYEPCIMDIINTMQQLELLDINVYSQVLASQQLIDIEIAYSTINDKFVTFAEETVYYPY